MLSSLAGRLISFTALMSGLGLLSGWIGWQMSGGLGLECTIWAAVLCIPPGWLVFSLEPLYRSPRNALYGSLFGTMLRMAVVLGGALLAITVRPELPRIPLVISLGVLYLGALAFETAVLLRSLPLRSVRGTSPSA